VTFGLALLLADLLVDAFIGWRYDVFTTAVEDKPGILQDWTALAADFGAIPILAGLYLWTIDGHNRLFSLLEKSTTFSDPQVVRHHFRQSTKYLANPAIFAIVIALGAVYAAIQVAAYHDWLPFHRRRLSRHRAGRCVLPGTLLVS
jgi:hypothetical protein